MCGIAGIWDKEGQPPDKNIVYKMISLMVHRGPDAEGVWSAQGLTLGHRRLKILDLSDTANQPFTDNQDALIFNGEVFNYVSLRNELRSRFNFKTKSDTEVLFRCLQHWGIRALNKIEGQFAFAFYRAATGTLMLARDHAGICPLYILDTNDKLYFSSEIKPLLSIKPSSLDPQGAADYFKYRYNIQNGHTLFAGIRRFPPAHFLLIDLNSGKKKEMRYWRLHFNERKRTPEECQEEFNVIFDEEIATQKMADVPVGLYLSGGVDSGALLYGFAKTTSNVRSYTLSFDVNDKDLARVNELTRRFNFQTNHIVFKPSNFGIIEDIVFSLEEPFGDLIIAANYILAQKASSSVKVVLSGEGGDEAFFGYDHERAFIKLMGLANNGIKRFLTGVALNLPSQIIGLAKSYPGKFGNDEVSRVRNVFGKMSDPAEAYLELVSLFSDKELGLLLKSNFSVQADTLPIKEIFSSDRETWQAIIRAEIEQLTLIVNLLKQERFGMCFSMEGRVPLISRKILEFAASLSFRELFPFVNKKLLLNYSNQRVVTKTPFSFLSNTWYQNAVIRLLDNYVTRESVEENGILSWPAIQGLRLSLEKGYMISIKKAMAVIIFHVWCRVFREKGYLH